MGKVFGAYTDIPWESSGGTKSGQGNTLIFSLREDSNFVKLKCLDNTGEVYHHEEYLTAIGYDYSGFWLTSDCNMNTNS